MGKFWPSFLLLSVLIHFSVFSSFFLITFPQKDKKKVKEIKEIEILPEEPEKEKKTSRQYELIEQEPLPYKENIIDKLLDIGKAKPSLEKLKPSQEKTDDLLISNVLKKENLQKSSVYMNYYRIIREKIRKTAYRNYKGRDQGKVYLNFNIAKDGSLQTVRFGQKSASNIDLKTIALSSIKKSAPFPAFPKELKKFSQLQFNISIYFKNN
ncbi:MAG: TonB C-terminal domain-containing protein [Candidatus Omnitrophica bacterium]|nr:TonB C-terminal domain-containing protein [Candidatus Omnitrophota bacterium]